MLLLCIFACGCHDAEAGSGPAARGDPQPFVETVPGSSVTFKMIPVFVRDVPEPTGRVIWLAETETTWDAYDVFYLRLDENPGDVAAAGSEGPDAVTRPTLPYVPPDRGWGHGGYPAMGVTFHAAQKYCEWLTKKTGRRYRLPTVAEWRAAAWGTRAASSWFARDAGGTTHPVAELAANRQGLYDLTGNVAEWCVRDDGTPVVLGGSFADDVDDITDDDVWFGRRQASAWNASDPSFPKSKWWLRDAPFVGFRVACEGPRR